MYIHNNNNNNNVSSPRSEHSRAVLHDICWCFLSEFGFAGLCV